MKKDIINLYKYIGVSPKYMGYKYLVDETLLYWQLTKENKEVLIKDLFDLIAEKYDTRLIDVEKDIRTCIEGTFNKGNLIHINDIFQGVSTYYDDRPSNKLFLTTIVNNLINK